MASLSERLGMCFILLTVQCSGHGSLPRTLQMLQLMRLKNANPPGLQSFMRSVTQGGRGGGLELQLRQLRSVQFSSATQSCPTLCDPMNHSTPGLTVYHQLPEFTQTHVHRVSDAIEPPHPLSAPSPPAPNPSQHQSLCQ